ncbi:hypothetical protein TH53_17955 [Pedobacter lusitanus]|uniref:Uncharacterized protein n=1 Tax=Pedobacter lusitanus TaxID=1503925 RepID=A0A0D0GNB8_9SPHI|nr:hypothetical protein [Pedobacter lusitanus]KIO75946.1 hypothetical protein TH53_17955 [Pedobacter lusitanus]
MSLDQQRLKQKIKTAIQAEQTEENSANTSLDKLSEAISQAVIAEIKAVKITYLGGLANSGGPVTGTINLTIE